MFTLTRRFQPNKKGRLLLIWKLFNKTWLVFSKFYHLIRSHRSKMIQVMFRAFPKAQIRLKYYSWKQNSSIAVLFKRKRGKNGSNLCKSFLFIWYGGVRELAWINVWALVRGWLKYRKFYCVSISFCFHIDWNTYTVLDTSISWRNFTPHSFQERSKTISGVMSVQKFCYLSKSHQAQVTHIFITFPFKNSKLLGTKCI